MTTPLSDAAAEAVDNLIRLFNEAPELNECERKQRSSAFRRDALDRIMDDGASLREAMEVPPMYDRDRRSFQRLIKHTDHDLEWQCETVSIAFSKYLKSGEIPAPYFPMRIAVLLRKAGERGRERAFLDVWCRHFRTKGVGRRFRDLEERTRKIRGL